MSDYSGEVMAEVLAQQALVKPQVLPLVPIVNQYRHPDHLDLKDYKSKVRPRAPPPRTPPPRAYPPTWVGVGRPSCWPLRAVRWGPPVAPRVEGVPDGLTGPDSNNPGQRTQQRPGLLESCPVVLCCMTSPPAPVAS